ncbi:hypothetical protein EDD22DRAFT_949818 [Suillus occidentalis]|nr:hypothetical protein EDD22DRAFT_949818 [Suillus occidentalis]
MHLIESNSTGIHNFFEGMGDLGCYTFRVADCTRPGTIPAVNDSVTLFLILGMISVVLDVSGSLWLTTDLSDSLVLAVLEVWGRIFKIPSSYSFSPRLAGSLDWHRRVPNLEKRVLATWWWQR